MAEQTNKKITISEFQAWLQGIHDLQGDDWAPTPEQWKKIKEKLFSIEGFDVPVEKQIVMLVERSLSKIRWNAFGPPAQAENNDWRQFNNTGGLPPAGTPAAAQAAGQPPQPQQVNNPPLNLPPAGSSLAGASAATPALTLPPGARVGNMDPNNAVRIEPGKTPDIDTSTGSYKSQFL